MAWWSLIASVKKGVRERRIRAGLWIMAGLGALFAVYLTVLFVIVVHRFEGKRWHLPSKVYSDSFALYPGQDLAEIHLSDRLRRLGYHSVSDFPRAPGEYHLEPGRLEIYLNDFSYADHAFKGFPFRLVLRDGRIVRMIELPEETELALVELEPELIAAYFDDAWEARDLIRLDEVAPELIEAIFSIEDTRFYRHGGIDFRGIARALWVDLREGEIVQGGSTLTQQLVKNFFLSQERTLTRKINEVFMALLLEARYTKDEILQAYLNEIYLGQNGVMGIYGVGEGSRFYFRKSPADLTLGEAALLAGMIKSPNTLSPYRYPERARARRAVVLDRMAHLGKIQRPDYNAALEESLPKHAPMRRAPGAPYYVDFVRRQLGDHYPSEVLTSEGLRIFTTLDMQHQRIAESVLVSGLEKLERQFPHLRREDPEKSLQGLLIAMQPQTGHIRAMVGGRDYRVSQFNRAFQAERQPGSLFKPFVYTAALSQALTNDGRPYTAASLIEDTPFTLMSEIDLWTPQNYDMTFHGRVTVRTALEQSLNVATARIAQEIGIERVMATARTLGIQSPLKNVPSLALGTSEVIPLEIASAYATIANGGMRVAPLAIKDVVDAEGRILERRSIEVRPALTPQQAYLLTYLLQGVVDRGTAKGVRALGFDRPVAGKTGTTSDYKDAWFLGFTPELLAVVWVGFDQSKDPESEQDAPGGDPAAAGQVAREGMRLTGAQAAMPIWTDYMKRSLEGQPVGHFLVPPGIVFRKIDPDTGLLSTRDCPGGVREAFIEGTEPQLGCTDSERNVPGGLFQWLKQLIAAP